MKKVYVSILIIMLLMGLSVSSSHAGWIIYNKPEYRGRIIDSETKKPIQGAVIVAIYYKFALVGLPGGPSAKPFHFQEALTDEKGEFVIPAYTAFLNPFYMENQIDFIIFKAGYFSYDQGGSHIYPFGYTLPQYLFLEKLDSKVEKQLSSGEKVTYTGGVVELPPVRKIEQRPLATPSPPTLQIKDTPFLYKEINEERRSRALSPIGR